MLRPYACRSTRVYRRTCALWAHGGPHRRGRVIAANAPRREVADDCSNPARRLALSDQGGRTRSGRGSQGRAKGAPLLARPKGPRMAPPSLLAAFDCRAHPFARGARAARSHSVRRATVVSPPRGGRCPRRALAAAGPRVPYKLAGRRERAGANDGEVGRYHPTLQWRTRCRSIRGSGGVAPRQVCAGPGGPRVPILPRSISRPGTVTLAGRPTRRGRSFRLAIGPPVRTA